MKTRKRLLAWGLSLAMCLSLLPTAAFAWSNWDGDVDNGDWPMLEKLTVQGKEFKDETGLGYVTIDGDSSGVTKAQVEAALQDLTTSVTPTAGAGAISYDKLSDAQKTAVVAYIGDEQGKDFYEKAPGASDDAYVKNLQEAGGAPTDAVCVGKFITIAWKDGAGDYYAKAENWYLAGTDDAFPILQTYAVFYSESSTWSIDSINTQNISLFAKNAGSGTIYVKTTNAPAETALKVEEVADADGTAKTTPTAGLSFGTVSEINSAGSANLSVTTTDETPAGTYYIKVSNGDGTVSAVGSFTVTETYAVALSVSPSTVAEQWTLYANRSGISDTSGVAYLPESVVDPLGGYFGSLVSLKLKDSDGTEYTLKNHPTNGEMYEGKTYLLDHFEVRNSDGDVDETVKTITGAAIHQKKTERNMTGNQTFLMPDHAISITAVFSEAYELELGDLDDCDSSLYSWYREGDTVSLANAISRANSKAAADGDEIQQVTVYQAGDSDTVILSKSKDDGFSDFSFTMPAHAVTVEVLTGADVTAKLESVGEQADVLVAGRSGTTTIEITTKNVEDGTQLTITPCGITGIATTPTGLSLSISTIQNNKATITVTTTTEIAEDTYYFVLSTSDGTVLEYSRAYHGSISGNVLFL